MQRQGLYPDRCLAAGQELGLLHATPEPWLPQGESRVSWFSAKRPTEGQGPRGSVPRMREGLKPGHAVVQKVPLCLPLVCHPVRQLQGTAGPRPSSELSATMQGNLSLSPFHTWEHRGRGKVLAPNLTKGWGKPFPSTMSASCPRGVGTLAHKLLLSLWPLLQPAPSLG